MLTLLPHTWLWPTLLHGSSMLESSRFCVWLVAVEALRGWIGCVLLMFLLCEGDEGYSLMPLFSPSLAHKPSSSITSTASVATSHHFIRHRHSPYLMLVNILCENNKHLVTLYNNCTGSDVQLIRISAKFDVDLCVTFLNFQAGGVWKDLVNMVTLHKLLVSSCNLIVVFCTSKSWKGLTLTFVWPFWTFKLDQGQLPCEHVNS